jgi:4-alpha-glucanotransferase
VVAVLGALGVAASDDSQRDASLAAYERAHWSRALPPTIVGQAGAQTKFWAHVTHGRSADADIDEIVLALHHYLGRTPSRLLGLALTDAVGEKRTQNQPGTIDEYPNWRVPLCGPDGRPILLEQVFNDSRATALAGIMHAQTAPSPSATC